MTRKNRGKRRAHPRRFFLQILSLTVGLLLILWIVFSAILYVHAKNATNTSVYLTEADRTGELLRLSTNSWRQLISAAGSFASMDVSYDNVSVTEEYHARNVLDSMIHSHVAANTYTRNIDVFISGKSTFPSSLSLDRKIGHFYFFDIYTEETPVWPYSFDLVTSYQNKFNKVEITVDAFFLSRYLFTFQELERMDFLLLPDDTILLCNHYRDVFKNIRDVLPDLSISSQDRKAESLLSFGDYYYLLTDEDDFGFRMLSLVPKSVYSAQYTSSARHTMLMSAGLLFVALAISLFLTFFFYRPVRMTLDLLQTYVPQELHDYENEIQFIQQNIEKYMGRSNTEAALPDTFTRIQNAQTAVLQHQINSHFLFNTLENIKAISITELGADNEIENSIILLNNIIHEGMFQKNLLVRLSYEMHLAESYLGLMLIRFPDVSVEWNVDRALTDCQIFKFTLQPILENCFTHAFKESFGRDKKIRITIRRDGEDLSIMISDNGPGVTAGEAMRISEALYTQNDLEGSRFVGMRNIHRRITDTFGGKYGIRLSDTSPGFTVEIRYPVLSEIEN